MSQYIFHNNKLVSQNLKIKKPLHQIIETSKTNVDINKLLNRVKLNQKHEKKSKVIFFFLGVLLISLMGIFLLIIK